MGQEHFTREEWRTLQFGPFWMLSALVGTYRNFDELELAAFWDSVRSAAVGSGQLAGEVLDSLLADVDRLTGEYAADGRPVISGLCAVARILDKVPSGEAELLKATLVSDVGGGVATARGKFGRVISEDDEKTLALLAQVLAA